MTYRKIKTDVVERLLRPYALVLFCFSPWVGAWFAFISFFSPSTALAGAFCLLCAWLWGLALEIKLPIDMHMLNGLLCGLFISSFYPLSAQLFIALVIVALFVTIAVNWLRTFMWNLSKIRAITLPFVLGTWLIIAVFHQIHTVQLSMLRPIFIENYLPQFIYLPWFRDFFSALGGLFIVRHPWSGILLFLGLFVASRYLALLSIAGYLVGALMLHFLGYSDLLIPSGYNFILVAIALGGIFIVPSIFSFFIALGGSALTAIFIIAFSKLLTPMHLPLLFLPFLLSTYCWLGGLGSFIRRKRGELNLEYPLSPELSWERARLNKARGLDIENAFSVPFAEEWRVEFDELSNNVYYVQSKNANNIDPIIFSPVYATVLAIRDGEEIIMVREGEEVSNPLLNTEIDKNLGNFVMLRDYLSQYIMIPHLKSESIIPRPGQPVISGQPLASCARMKNSEYQLYLESRKGVRLTSENVRYYLINVVVHQANTPKQFYLFYRPIRGDYVAPVYKDDVLEKTLSLPATLSLQYNIQQNHNSPYKMRLETGMTPDGQSRLYASRESSAAYVHTNACLVFYDRKGKTNILLDMWILALGLTPLTNEADVWYDKPSLKLWPLSFVKRVFVGIIRPLGVGCESRYTRVWNEAQKIWEQTGVHQANIMPGVTWTAKTKATIDPLLCIRSISLEAFGHSWKAEFVVN